MRRFPEDTMALVIDYQERLMPVLHEKEQFIHRSTVLLSGLKMLGIPMLVTRQYPKGLGDTIPSIKKVVDDAPVFDKIAFSCYDDVAIKRALDAHERRNIILCGAEAHICVIQTLIDLCAVGYQVLYVEDCVTSRKKTDRDTALHRAAYEGAAITSCEAILFELARVAGTENFKYISKLVK